MKRFFFLAVAATAMLAACNKTEIVPAGDAQEISFVAVNKVATKVPVDGAAFDKDDDMDVVAHLVNGYGVNEHKPFFKETNFDYNSTTDSWTGGRYWPLSDAVISFLAVTNTGGKIGGHVQNTFDSTTPAAKVESVLTGNDDATQTDLMFAAGVGTHNQGDPYTKVGMVFKHALSWINFTVKTTHGNTASDPKITVNSITLNDPYVNGTLTVTNDYYADPTNNVTEKLATDWSGLSTADMKVIETGITTTEATDELLLTTTSTAFGGNGILVVPGKQTSFTINYTITQPEGTSSTFEYTHLLNTAETNNMWVLAKKYVYNITMSLTEIQITPSVTPWGDPNVSNPEFDGVGVDEKK